ncbi:MAG TPA: OmpA family protein [Bryobacteraceae bacterium]|nr:OmpA family protein [Bryobacteraceae bacterium]
MLRTYTTLITLSCLLVACSWAQGLDTKASKNDWEEINFEFNSAVLSDGYPSLLRLADLLSKNPGYHVRVEGNTDNIGGKGYNEKLGLARANTVREFLVKYGAKPDQITAVSRGKDNPGYSGYKNRFAKTDVARWMNRRVVLTVTDQNGKVVGDGGVGEAIAAVPQAPEPQKCCDDILKRLDKLDDIARMLRDLADQNAGLRREIDNLKQQEAALENKVNGIPKPLTEEQTASVVDKRLEAFRDPRFSLLGLNAGADNMGRITFSGAGRYFAPYKDHFAVQAQAEYLYFHDQKEAQFDVGMVDRIGRFQGGLFASFKHVQLSGYQNGGTLGQGSAVFDYIFKQGTVGVFGTKGFLDNPILDTRNLVLSDGSIAPNIFTQRFLHIVDQAGVQTTLALVGRTYLQGNVGYLKSYSYGDRIGGTLRFVFPISDRFAFTAEGGINETMLPVRGSNGRAVFGITWGNLMRPKEFAESKYPVPAQVPRIRYEVVSRTIHRGTSPPVADAGPDQIGIPAGTVTLNGSGSHDPNGEALKFQWVQEAGPLVQLSNPTAAITTFQATDGQAYTFRLTVTNTDGQYASARTHVTTVSQPKVNILFFIANPSSIQTGQSSQLQYSVQNATTVTISSIGNVNPSNGSLSVSPTQTTTYTLTATNATSTQTAQATITVTTPQPQFLTCTATPMTIISGESATVVYATQNATSVTVSPSVGTVQPSGSFVVSPTQTTTYTLTATNASLTATCSVTVSVTPGSAPQIVRFSGAPLTIPQGGTSTLVWQVSGADTVTIQPQLGTVALVGTQDVTLQATTMYTLTATNKFGTATASVTITVTTPPPPPPTNPTITSFTANPPTSPSPGAPVVLTCLAKDATTVTINGVGPVNAQGQVTVNPQVNTTYTCTATGASGTTPATATVTVTVTQTPPPPPPPPVIIVTGLNGLQCAAPTVPAGGGPSLIICETVVRVVQLDLSQSSSPSGATPLSYLTTSRNIQAAVLNPTSVQPTVELSALFGDYFFDITVTDSKGNLAQGVVDIRYIRTTPQ